MPSLITLLFTASTSLALAAAFNIPDGQPNGVYAVRTHGNGTDYHVMIGDAAPVKRHSTAKPPAITPDSTITCASFNMAKLNPADTDMANSNLDAQCGGGTDYSLSDDRVYSIHGDTVAFFCNFSNKDQVCYASVRQSASRAITEKCGLYIPGWVDEDNISYGYDHVGIMDFCGGYGK